MRKAAFVRLTSEQRAELADRLEREAINGRRRRHFQILLLADQGQTDDQIAAAAGASRSTVERHRGRFAREGMEAALTDKPRSGAPAKLDGKQEAMIVRLGLLGRARGAGRAGPPSCWPTAPSSWRSSSRSPSRRCGGS